MAAGAPAVAAQGRITAGAAQLAGPPATSFFLRVRDAGVRELLRELWREAGGSSGDTSAAERDGRRESSTEDFKI